MVSTSPVLKWLITIQTVLLIFLAFLYTYLVFFGPEHKQQMVSTYEECIALPGSVLQESYPATCVTKNNQRFTQPLTAEEEAKLQPPSPTPAKP